MVRHIKSKDKDVSFSFWYPGSCDEYGLDVCELDFVGHDERIVEFRGLLFPIDKLDLLIEFLNEVKGNL